MRLAGVSLSQFLKTTVIAVLGILLFKFAARKSGIAGVQSVAAAV